MCLSPDRKSTCTTPAAINRNRGSTAGWTSWEFGSIPFVMLSLSLCMWLSIRQYYPVMNTPVSSSVTLFTDPPVHAKLREDIVEGDPDSVLRDEVRVFHGLSVSGDVTGKFVYAGYGRKADFDLLQDKGQLLRVQAQFMADNTQVSASRVPLPSSSTVVYSVV